MKAALITGASKGIGRATAIELKKEGYWILLHGRNRSELSALEMELGQTNSTLALDLSLPGAGERLATETLVLLREQGLKLKALVNNAGIFRRHSCFEKHPTLWREQFEVNLFASVDLTESLLDELKKQAPSSIVNISSTLGLRPSQSVAAYSASKAAMISWTQNLALECAAMKIRVNCVAPGIVETPIHGFDQLSAKDRENLINKMSPLQPLGRIGQPEEIAKAIAFLISENSAWTTGTTLSVDGGIGLT